MPKKKKENNHKIYSYITIKTNLHAKISQIYKQSDNKSETILATTNCPSRVRLHSWSSEILFFILPYFSLT